MKKRILSMLLALTMIVGMLPLSALTATAASAKHYDVSNWGELRQVLEWDSGSTPVTITLTADIYEESTIVAGDIFFVPVETVQIIGNKTLNLDGYSIEVNDKSNRYDKYSNFGIESTNTLFCVKQGASLTIEDVTGEGNITFTGHMVGGGLDGYCTRDIFDVEGSLTLNGGTIEAGRSKKQWIVEGVLNPSEINMNESFGVWRPTFWGEERFNGYAYQQIFGTAVNVKNGGAFTMNGGSLYGRGYGKYLDRMPTIENLADESFRSIRDEVVNIASGGTVHINMGSLCAKGGANMFAGDGVSAGLTIRYGAFVTDSVDYVRSLRYQAVAFSAITILEMRDVINSCEAGAMGIPKNAWIANINDVTVVSNGTVYDTTEEKNTLNLSAVSGTVVFAPIAEDGFCLEFVNQNPQMPAGYDTWHMYQAYGETINYTFDHIDLTSKQISDGYYVERSYTLRNALDKSLVASDSGIVGTDTVTFTHTWNEVGTFTLYETLTLKDKSGAEVKKLTHTFHIFVVAAVDHIEITTPPTQNTYISNIYKSGGYSLPGFYGEGMVVTAHYTDGTTEDVTKYVDFNRTLAIDATQNAISYTDPVFEEEHFAFQPVTVEKAYQISTTSKGGAAYDNERVYYAAEGTKLDLLNTIQYDTSRYQLDGWTVTRDDNGEPVEVHEYINGGSYYFIMPNTTVTIEPNWNLKKVVESIQIQTPPTKTNYYEGELFNPAGMALRVFYTDGTWEDLKDEALKPYLHVHETIYTGISRYLKISDTAVFVQFNGFTARQPINVTKSTGIYSIELTMDGYGYGKNVADFTLSLDTDHIRFTEAGNITDGFDLDRWNGSTSATVTSGTFGIYEYDLSIAIQLDAGYIKQFTADTVTVNGIKARSIKSMGSGKYIIGFALPNFIVSEVNLTVADPTPGMTPIDLSVIIPAGSHYGYLGSTQWTAWNEKTQTGWTMGGDGKFAAGVTYSTTLILVPSEGFVFEDTWYELSATINGEAATITRLSDGTVAVEYEVTIPENPPATLISNITSYVDGECDVTVELYKTGEATPAYTATVTGTIDNPALVVISNIEDGTYTMKVTKPYHAAYTTTVTAEGNTIYEDVTLTANTFVATFHLDGDPVAWQEVAKGGKVVEPEAPAKTGKVFAGWYTSEGQLYNFNTSVTDNVNLYARFDYEINIVESLTVNCIGDIDYTVSGNVVTVDHEVACKVGYLSGSKYVAITAVANGDGTYSFTAPTGVTEVLLVVKGDVSGDGFVTAADKMTMARSLLLTTHPAYQALNAIQTFAGDMDNANGVIAADKMTLARSLLLTTHPAYQALTW